MTSEIVKSINTEKSHKLQDSGIYVFLFPKKTRKDEIKKIVEKKYSVKIDSVNTVNLCRKMKSFRGRLGCMTQYKKAYIRFAKGMKIESESVKK